MTNQDPATIVVACGAMFVGVCLLQLWQLYRRDHTVLLVWPALIYMSGPALTLLFVDTPVLGRYVWPEELIAATSLMFAYCLVLSLAGYAARLGPMINSALARPAVVRAWWSPLFLPIFLASVALATVLQSKILLDFGSILSGSYVLDNVAEGLIPYWGFLAGLYEIIFLCFVLFLLGEGRGRKHAAICVALYVLTTVLRVAGGTRLILVKELAFILLVLYLRGSLKARHLVFMAGLVIVAGSAVGLLRSSDIEGNAWGPLYGLVMESALNALTLNIGFHAQSSGYVAQHADLLRSLAFFGLGVVPSFLRLGIDAEALDQLAPYAVAFVSGSDTPSPVGGMSGFATLTYLSSYPLAMTLALALAIVAVVRFLPGRAFRSFAILVFAVNSIHFWRDPSEIAFKLILQGMLVCLALHVVKRTARRRAVGAPVVAHGVR